MSQSPTCYFCGQEIISEHPVIILQKTVPEGVVHTGVHLIHRAIVLLDHPEYTELIP